MPGLVSAVTVEDPYESRRSSSLGSAHSAEPVEPGVRGCLQAFQKKNSVLFELVKAWIIVGGYIVVGILMYIYALEEPWTVVDTMYFSVTTMSTVGYGDLYPGGPYSRGFSCLYIIVGVTYVFSVIAKAATIGMNLIELQNMRLVHCCQRMMGINPDVVAVDLDGDGDVDYIPPPPAWVYYSRGIGFWVVVLFILQAAFVGAFTSVQPGLKWNEAAYHCFVTMTTVGYGDVGMATQEARFVATVHILVSVTLLATFISKAQALYSGRLQELKRAELLRKQLDIELITSLDKNGDGVNKLEFVVGMLIKLEIIAEADVEPFDAQFDAMDTDGGGLLTAEDLEAMVKAKLAKQEAKKNEAAATSSPSHIQGRGWRPGAASNGAGGEGTALATSHPSSGQSTPSNATPTDSPKGSCAAPGAADGKPLLKPGESPLAVGGRVDAKPRPKKRSPSELGDQQDRLETLAQQAIDRIRVLEADGQLRREHAKKIEHSLDEHARVQLRLEESLRRIHDLLAYSEGSGRRGSHRSSRQSGSAGSDVGKSPNSRGDASPARDRDTERRLSDGRATTRDDARGRTVRKRVPVISSSTDSQTGAREATEAKAAEQIALTH